MNTSVPHGLNAYYFWLQQYAALLEDARNSKNPALYLFENNLRTPAFMLQALGRVYRELHNKKRFTKMRDNFKEDEDMLGQIDYYSWLIKCTKSNKKLSAIVSTYLTQKLNESLAKCNIVIAEKYFDSDGLLKKFHKKLDTARWLNESDEVRAFKEFYSDQIAEIDTEMNEALQNFVDVEAQMHETRRQLRWLSIYPQALNGAIQYAAVEPMPAALKPFVTSEVKASQYNKLPTKGKRKQCLLVRKNQYYTLSAQIAVLGDLKDKGLLLNGVALAIANAQKLAPKEALAMAASMLRLSANTEQEILAEAKQSLMIFRKNKVLNNLVTK
jgi:CRISPR/Cas system-associated protein endoribonuclease Cas2